MQIELTSHLLAQLQAEAEEAAPAEACGILVGRLPRLDALRRAANVSRWPHTRFEIDPRALIDAHRAARRGGGQVIGYYHSHPASNAVPSARDRELAPGDGAVWAIIGTDGVRFWRDMGDGFEALSYRVADG